jgi:predicted Ser/Thr protein kinase
MSVSDLSVGSELLGYRVEGVLGRGGMGVVYLAEDLRLRRRVALKLLAPRLAEDQAFRKRFLVESELAASLDHPSVVPIYAAGETDEGLFIAMRFVEGSDLKGLLRGGPLAAERAVRLCAQVADALDFAHERGLVHRDVKPSNVLLDARDHVYLADFGLTRRLAEPGVVEPGLFGTIDYVAAEQIRGEEVDGRADVYSLGCLLCECLTGEPPFARSTDAAVLFAHLEEEPAAPPGLERVIAKALAKEPDARYGTCSELVDAASEALGIGEAKRDRRPLVLAAAGVALLVAALVAFFLARSGGAPAPTGNGLLARIDPSKATVAGSVRVGTDPTAVAVGRGWAWVATRADSSLWRVDPRTLSLTRIAANGTPLGGVAVSSGQVYVGNVSVSSFSGGNVTRFDAASGAQVDVLPIGGPYALAPAPNGIWAVVPAAHDVVLHLGNGAAGTITTPELARVALPNPKPFDAVHFRFEETGVAVGEGGVWVLGDAFDPRLWRIDPERGRIEATISLPFAPAAVATGAGAVWVTGQLNDRIVRIDPGLNRIVATIPVGREPLAVAVGAGAVWVANTIDRTVVRIDPRTNTIVERIAVGMAPKVIAVGDGSVWVAGDAS